MGNLNPTIDYSKKASFLADTEKMSYCKRFKKECWHADKMDVYYELVKTNEDFKQFDSLQRSRRKKTKRINNNLTTWLQVGSVIFGTLTFTDDVLKKTSAQTRKRYVERYLKQIGFAYIANVDYGSKNGREHYHFVVATGDKNKLGKWQYGFTKLLNVGDSESDSTRVSKYISKLSNHAVKHTNKRCVIIYSKNKEIDCDFEKVFN